jgi:indolepyruvate ferredoxin oxidoreductase
MTAFRWLARARRWRGTPFDLFGRGAERRAERQLIADYEHDVAIIVATLTPTKLTAATELASLPAEIRGFGPVKILSIEATRLRRANLIAQFQT